MLTPQQLTTIKNELQGVGSDPEGLGYAPFFTGNQWDVLAALLCFVRDGVTPCPLNNVIGPTGTITGATNATPIVVTSTAHGRSVGDSVVVSGVLGNTGANGTWTISAVTANTFTLSGSAGSGAYTSGGTWAWCVNGIVNPSVSCIDVLGAIAVADLITNGLSTAVTADQFGKFQLLVALCNQASGQINLTDSSGNENNNAKTLKQVVGNATASKAAIAALEKRLGARCEQLLGLSGTVNPQSVNGTATANYSNLISAADVQAAIAGHY